MFAAGKRQVLLASMVCLLTACSQNNQTSGQVIGGVTGAIIGQQFGEGENKALGAAIGAIAGTMIGGHIGSQLDEQDKIAQQNSLGRALNAPIGTDITWHNPSTGHRGSLTPIREGHDINGYYCRELSQTIVISHQPEHSYHRLCQYKTGQWYLVD